VGKFAQRAEADPETYRTLSNLHEFAVTDQHGQISYHHAAYTWQFIEDHLSWLTRIGNGEGNVAQWAARHHKPSTVWDWVVAEADRLSAGMDRGHLDEAAGGWTNVQIARLIPLLARIGGVSSSENFSLPMRPLALDDRLFPQPAIAVSRDAALVDYRTLFNQFAREVDRIQIRDVASFLQTFLSVYERYAWCVPAATNALPRDISLVEHSRAASAIAAALTGELYANGTPTIERVRDHNARRYTLAVGDLGGIQRFLYTIVTRNAARALRGRSLALQLLTDAIAHRFLDSLGLPAPCLLYNGGGKIWLLLPASARESAFEMAEAIDLELHSQYGGRLSFSLGTARVRGVDFIDKRIADAFEVAAQDMQTQRRRRFATVAREHYEKVFAPWGDPATERACGVCGKLDRLMRLEGEDRLACPECKGFEELGRAAIRMTAIVRATGADWHNDLAQSRPERGGAFFHGLPFFSTGYLLYAGAWEELTKAAGPNVTLFHLNQPPDVEGTRAPINMWLVGTNRARDEEGAALDFDGIASASEGIERLGVLRMDVDDLGEILRTGLPSGEASFSRITNLSRGLSYFFGGHLSTVLNTPQWQGKAQIIYSGGDDLFIVGAWSAIPLLAREIRNRFARFVCGNPVWGLSGGIAVVRPRTPIAGAADISGDEERRAKQYQGRTDGRSKDALCFLGEALSWRDFDVVAQMTETLCELLRADNVNKKMRIARSMLHRLGDIAANYRESRRAVELRSGEARSIAEIEGAARRGRWAWTAAYTIARASGSADTRRRLDDLSKALPTRIWMGLDSDRDLIWLLARPCTGRICSPGQKED
jgi:CRISPR-associated protein Csm1